MRIARLLILIAIIFFAVRIGDEFRVRAQAGCTAQNLSGPYTFTFRGAYIGDSFGNLFDLSETGRLVADGNGAFSGTETVSNDEAITRGAQFTGSYTVNDDCTGSATFKDTGGKTIANYDFAIANSGRQVDFIETDRGTNIAGKATQQFPSPPSQ